MEIREHPQPYKFMPVFPRHEPAILDSYAMQAAKKCLRYYFFKIVLGMNSKGKTPPYFTFGSAYHKFREVLELEYKLVNPEKTFTSAEIEDAQKTCFVSALKEAILYYDKATGGKNPDVGDKFDFLTRERLIQSCAISFTHWKKEKSQNRIQVLAVEQPFNVQLGNIDGEHTSGRFDQIVRWNGKIYGRDFKTSSKEGMFYQRGLDPNDQFTRYTYAEQKLAGQRVEGQLIEVLYNSKTKGPLVNTYISSRTQWQLDDWEKSDVFHRETIRRARELDTWPLQEVSCSFCEMHSVCKMGSEGSQIMKLKSEFVQKPWDNMTVHLQEG